MGVTLVGAVLDIVPWSALVAVVPAALGGLAIYLGLGYLLGGTVANGQLATNLATLVQISTLFLTGVALPFDLLPSGLADTLAWLPTGQFGDLLLWAMDSPLQHHAWWQSLAYALAVGSVLVAAAVRLFRWDAQAR